MSDLVLSRVPGSSDYGAVELKELIRKYTYRGFFIAIGILMLLILLYYANQVITESTKPKLAPVIKTELVDIPPESAAEELPPPPPPEMIVNTGPAVRAGTPVAIPDAEMKPDMQEFATIDVMDRASAAGGNGVDLGGFASGIDFEGSGKVQVQVREEIPDPDDFIAVEKEPAVDIVSLQKLVEYPELARKAGIEGRVIIRVFVRKDGSVVKPFVEFSDNSMLDKSALSAISKYGKINPAIQNGQPVDCWVSIPITFRLR
jgi:protein TonB